MSQGHIGEEKSSPFVNFLGIMGSKYDYTSFMDISYDHLTVFCASSYNKNTCTLLHTIRVHIISYLNHLNIFILYHVTLIHITFIQFSFLHTHN